MDCPILEHVSHRKFEKDAFWIHECATCELGFVEMTCSKEHVSKVYGDDYFTEGGAGYSNYLGEADIITAHGENYGKLLSKYTSSGKVLDVGAAAGFILKGLEKHGWEGLGLEPNATMAKYGNKHFGVKIEVGNLEDFQKNEEFDLVTMIQVLPHFYDLWKALKSAAEHTKPSGYWLIETWNKDSCVARMLGKNWHEYSPPSTLYFFSPNSLRKIAGHFGFTEVARGRPTKKISGKHAKSLLQYKLQGSSLGKLGTKLTNILPNKIAIPYPSFDLFWALYQKEP